MSQYRYFLIGTISYAMCVPINKKDIEIKTV